ncbi:MAG TPA: RdgB/HAM1 family non-canonical purine NTP pyrophosphatase [Cyclobacteriaceae bacterium]
MIRILFASNNEHKLSEVRSILGPDFRVLSLADVGFHEEIPETQDTMEGNAEQKVRYVFERHRMPCLADDSGLEVNALNGAPGVHSARYAGVHGNSAENIRLLLKNLDGVDDRSARFKCVLAYMDDTGHLHRFEGTVNGSILTEQRGTGGFGYDPVFVPKGYEKTFAEMKDQEKNAISHRTNALRKFAGFIRTSL